MICANSLTLALVQGQRGCATMINVGRSPDRSICDAGQARGSAPTRPGVFSYWNNV